MKSYPGYIGIIRSYYKGPYEPTRIKWKVGFVFLRGSSKFYGSCDFFLGCVDNEDTT